MKPILITMSAFGSYAGREEIDFASFHGGVVLVSGKTGSGKSTIFNAMSYALYGGGEVGRSDYAEEATPTYVELLFEHGGRHYTVKRCPEYMRKAKRGSGMTKEAASAELTCRETGEVQTKAIEKRIEELIGLNREQFYQTMMIRQGQFRDILVADSEKRKTLLRKVFGTEIYNRFLSQLKEECDEKERQGAEIERRIKDVLGDFSGYSGYPLQGEVLSLRDTGRREEFLAAIPGLVSYCEAETEKREAEKKELSQRRDALLAEQENRKHFLEVLDKTSKLLERYGNVIVYADEIKRRQEKILLYERAKYIQSDIENAARCRKNYEETYQKKSIEEGRYEELRLQTERIYAECERAERDFTAVPEHNIRLENLKKARAILAELGNLQREKEIRQKELAVRALEYEKKDGQYRELYHSFIMAQAGLLAKDLQEGEPCPVCGSRSHPQKAKLERDISKAQVDRAEQAKNAAKSAADEVSSALEVLQTKIEEKHKSVTELNVSEQTIDAEIRTLQQEVNKLTKERDEAVAQKTEHDNKLHKIKGSVEVLAEQVHNLGRQALEAEAKAQAKLAEKGFAALEEYQSAIAPESAVQGYRRQVSAYISQFDGVLQDEKSLEAQLLGYTNVAYIPKFEKPFVGEKDAYGFRAIDKTALEEMQVVVRLQQAKQKADEDMERFQADEACKNQIAEAEIQIGQADKTLHDLARAKENAAETMRKLKAQLESSVQIREEYATAKLLDDTFRQAKTGSVRIDFEAYILQYYFKEIIAEANRRLRFLTDGVFRLELRDGNTVSRVSKTGLDLDIYDGNTGTLRRVETLSGGESFMASLSLALGLSDVVQRKNGGVKMDAMFIDEGFGSLDEEALTVAVDLLAKLAGESGQGRLIGVISHVEELERRIDKKIIVDKGKTGSTVRIVR